MKKLIELMFVFLLISMNAYCQQEDWSGVENVFGKKGVVQGNVFKISYPRSDLKVTVGEVNVAPGFALGSWIGFMPMDMNNSMSDHSAMVHKSVSMMGDLVLLDTELPQALRQLVEADLRVTAIHNHLINESPNVKYVHFAGMGERVKLAQAIKSVLAVTGTPLAAPATPAASTIDWTVVESILGNTGKHNGMLLQYTFPRKEDLKESGMVMPPFMGMATAINFQKIGEKAAITGDFVLLANEINPAIKILISNGITPTALHNHMIHDEPRLFMMHFWAVDDPFKLAKALYQVLNTTNHIQVNHQKQ